MSQIILKQFQKDAIAELKKKFLTLWQLGDKNLSLIFQSPTGSGKTIMMAEFLRDMTADPRFSNSDVAYIWITNSDDLAMQSKNKLWNYYGGANEISLLTVADVKDGKLPQNGVFFVNWQKLVQSRKNMRPLILRTEGESNTTFDEYLLKTHTENRAIILIIDEEHIASDTVLANDLVQNIIKPRIVLRVSATPKGSGVKVDVKSEDVVNAGLIKEKIIFQTAEDLQLAKETDQDKILLELAFNKRNELVEKYKELGLSEKINPLVLIQLPNDDAATRETNATTKEEVVKIFLNNKGVHNDEIATWLADKKENLYNIEKNDSEVSFLLFKQAAATGWDCPRASILLMFREIQNPTFAIQTVGRILRMPLGEHFPTVELNRGYIFTNYTRNEVSLGYRNSNSLGQNNPSIYRSLRRENIVHFELESTVISRTNYNDLYSSFEFTFRDVADKYFGFNDDDFSENFLKKLKQQGLDTSPKFPNSLIVDIEIDDFDNFIFELQTKGSNEKLEVSQNDVERLYNLLCFQTIAKQTDENKKYAPERSYGRLKTALNVWFGKIFSERNDWYRVIVKDLLKAKTGNSILAKVIDKALEAYRPVYEKEVGEREAKKKQIITVEVPPAELSFSDLYAEKKVEKCAMFPYFVEKKEDGQIFNEEIFLEKNLNEGSFVEFLENNSRVIWWHKNGENGREFFAIPYIDKSTKRERLFYPDWFVKTVDKTWTFDTKSGWTFDDAISNGKAKALSNWLSNNPDFAGGIVSCEADIWKIYCYHTGVKKVLEF